MNFLVKPVFSSHPRGEWQGDCLVQADHKIQADHLIKLVLTVQSGKITSDELRKFALKALSLILGDKME